MALPIYIDIDGTLTDSGMPNGTAIESRVEKVRRLIDDGKEVVLWSGNGTEYAKRFAAKHNLRPLAIVGKPELCVDDNPTLRPRWELLPKDPSWLDT